MTTRPTSAVVADLAPTGSFRAAINLGNPVLAQGSAASPSGVTVDIARAVADRLGVPVSFLCFDAARRSFDAVHAGAADLGFLAIEPARAADLDFTAPYVVIEGVYAVPGSSPIATAAEVDREGVRVGVKLGSAYDLFLTRTLEHAEIVRDAADGIEAYRADGLDVAAGIRQPITSEAARHGLRVLEPGFMRIRQSVAVAKGHRAASVNFLHDLIEELKADGFVAEALARSGQEATVAPPA